MNGAVPQYPPSNYPAPRTGQDNVYSGHDGSSRNADGQVAMSDTASRNNYGVNRPAAAASRTNGMSSGFDQMTASRLGDRDGVRCAVRDGGKRAALFVAVYQPCSAEGHTLRLSNLWG